MTQVSKRLPVLLALLVGLAMAFAVWGAAPNAVFANNEIQLDEISLENGSEGERIIYYPLNVKEGEVLTEGELGIVVSDENGNEVNRDYYDLVVKPTWWDEEAGEDVYGEAADLINGFALAGPNVEAGFTEYDAFITAKEGSGYVGESSAHFFVIDKYSLNYVCAKIDYPGSEKTGWRMHDWFIFQKGAEISPIVKAECGKSDPLGEDNYIVTYYPRSHQDEMDDSEHGFDYFLDTSVDPLDGPPTQPGGYFAVIDGTDPYYGSNTVLIDLKDANYDYYDEPCDETLLLYDDREIRDMGVHVEDAEHPNGWDTRMRIISAEIIGQHPDSGHGNVLSLNEDEWKYFAENTGSADIRVSYENWDGTEVIRTFTIFVLDTTYEVNLWSEENIYKGFPGDEIVLFAWGEKKWIVQDGGNPDNWHEEGTSDNLAYKWEITEGDDFATLSKDENEPYRAVLIFNPMPAGWDSIGERVKVKVSIREDSDDVNTERAANENDFSVEDDYYQIYPTTINTNLLLGETTELKPELRHYQLGKDFSVVDNVEFEINNYKDNEIEVGGGNGTFTIKRLQQWDTNFSVRANWNGGDPEEQWYHLNGKHYRAEFGFGDVDVYDDYHVTLTPEIQDGEELNADDYEVTYRLGRFEWNEENEAYDTEFEVDADSGVYEVNGKSITIYGDKLAALGRNNLEELRIIAHLKINGIDCEDTDCWINSRESCTTWGHKHNWIKGIAKQPTLDEVGYEVWICPGFMVLEGCGETRLWEIPKLIDIADATVAVKNQTYTGKALKPALTVTYGGKTLKAGTDYTATYTNNTKVGTATVTLKGIGTAKVTPEGQDYPDLFGGTKKATFKIVKAKNPMVVKTKVVTLKAKDVKKKNQTIKQTAAFAVTKNQGKVTYKKKSGDAKITIAANGTVTVKKGLKKGKYKFVVNVTAAGNANYNKITKAATVNITVK